MMMLPSQEEINLLLLKLIVANPKISSVKEIVELLAKEFRLTEAHLGIKDTSDVGKFYKHIILSLALLTSAGYIFKNRKPFRATDDAYRLIRRQLTKITKLDLDKRINARKEQKLKKEEELIRQVFIKKCDEYLEKIKNMNKIDFEYLSGLVLSKVYNINFFTKVEITPPSNDRGIDGILHLGEDEESKVYFQAKCLKGGSVGEPLVTQFSGALDRVYGTKGYYVTTTKYAPRAKEYVKVLRYKDIKLIDGCELVELIFKYKLENEIKLD
ncbi:restriction endonuclease [Bacillus tropicus]|uniref:restriction endonuclease n=1 Tax=Bacillus tropicus TaxID=2026188 RepID=UPI003D9A3BF9